MGRLIAATAALLFGVFLVGSWLLDHAATRSGEREVELAGEPPVNAVEEPSLDLVAAPAEPGDDEREAVATGIGARTADAPALDPEDPRLARLTGRFLLENGAPAAGVSLILSGRARNATASARHGEPEHWADVRATSGADGRFELRFLPPLAFQFALDASLAGAQSVTRSWSSLAEGAVFELGDMVLTRSGSLRIHLVDLDGTPVRAAQQEWRVHVKPAAGPSAPFARSRVMAQREDDGSFLARDVAPGTAEISAHTHLSGWVQGPPVVVRAGVETEVTMVHRGPDISRMVLVEFLPEPIYAVYPEHAKIALTGDSLAEPVSSVPNKRSGGYMFTGLDPGEYTVTVEDPRFERLVLPGLRPGSYVQQEVGGSAAIRLAVTDALTGEAIERYGLSIRAEDAQFSPDTYPLMLATSEPPSDGRYRALVPHDYALILEAEGYPRTTVPVPGLAAGEEREVPVALSSQGGVSGVVIEAGTGAAVAGVTVELYRAAVKGADWWQWWGQDRRAQNFLTKTTADENGLYRLATNAEGPLLVRAIAGDGLHGLADVERTPEQEVEGVRVTIPVSARVTGSVLAPDWATFEGIAVRIANRNTVGDVPATQWEADWDRFQEAAPAPDGSFAFSGFPTGPTRVAVVWSPREGAKPSAQALIVEETVELTGGANTIELDALERWPGKLVLRVFAGGEPAAGLRVDLRRDPFERWGWLGPWTTDGEGRIERTVAGGRYLPKFSLGGLWDRTEEEAVTVRPGETSDVLVELPHASGRMLVIDGRTGAPLAGRDVYLVRLVDDDMRYAKRRTDPAGELALVLPESTYYVRRSAPPRGKGEFQSEGEASFSWPASGRVRSAVELP